MSANSTIAMMLESTLANSENMTFTRCGKCEHKKVLDNGNISCQRLGIEVEADFFCAYGEKAEQRIRERENVR